MGYTDKTIVAEVTGWLRVYEDGSVDRTWAGPPAFKFMSDPVPAHENFINGVATRDVTVGTNQVRLYLPQKIDDKKLPILLHFHGGGFCISRPDWFMYHNMYTRLVRSAQAICISVYLRLAPENPLPTACNDGFAALLWLRSLARLESHEPWLTKHGDFNRVFLIGDSSGGNIVHQVAACGGQVDLRPLRVAGGIPIHPGFVRSERSRSEVEQPESPFLTLEMVDKFLGMALPAGSTKDHPITWPMGPSAPSIESLKLPPMLLCVAEKDMLIDTEMEYYEALKKGGKDVELLINPGMGHSFYLNTIMVNMDTDTGIQTSVLIQGIVDFINKY